MCYRISDMGLCKVEKGHTYTLVEFRDAQFATLNEVTHFFSRAIRKYCHKYQFMKLILFDTARQ